LTLFRDLRLIEPDTILSWKEAKDVLKHGFVLRWRVIIFAVNDST
jgi:hypothetical protein